MHTVGPYFSLWAIIVTISHCGINHFLYCDSDNRVFVGLDSGKGHLNFHC